MNIAKIYKANLIVFTFLLPFVSAFALTPIITLSVLFSLIMLGFTILHVTIKKEFKNPFSFENVIIVGLWVFILVSFLFNNIGRINSKAINHMMAYTFTLFLFFVMINQHFKELNTSKKTINLLLKCLLFSIFFASVFANIEFILKVKFGIDINNYIPRAQRAEYDIGLASFIFTRVRGFAEESGQHAMMMETLMPVSLYYLCFKSRFNISTKLVISAILTTSFIFTFSGGAFVFLPLSIFIAILIEVFKKGVNIKYLLGASFIVIFINYLFKLIFQTSLFEIMFGIVSSKLSDNSASKEDRSVRFGEFIEVYLSSEPIQQFFGYGPSGFRLAGLDKSILSLYPTILMEGGFLGLLLLLIFFAFIFIQILKIESKISPYLMTGFLACCMHYVIVGGYWRPWIWYLCGLILFIRKLEKSHVRV